MKFSYVLQCALAVSVAAPAFAGQPADLSRLSQSGFIMGSGSSSGYRVHDSWKNEVAFMAAVDAFDEVVDQVQSIACGTDRNKSVLLVGNPDEVYRYIFARIVSRANPRCAGLAHVEIDTNKIEAGHHYVGDVEEYWNSNILQPADGKDVILYLSGLGKLVGVGSHEGDNTGIESEYVANLSAGRIRTIAFMDKYEYNEMSRSRNAYVVNAFAEKLVVPDLASDKIDQFVQAYLSVLFPTFKLQAREATYLYKAIAYYQPNRTEPDRTMSVLKKMIRNVQSGGGGGGGSTPLPEVPVDVTIESAHPYTPNAQESHPVEHADASQLALYFDMVDTEQSYDVVEIVDTATGTVLDRFQGQLQAFQTQFYATNKLTVRFHSDGSNERNGYKISRVIKRMAPSNGGGGGGSDQHAFTMEEVRRAIMEVAQVPEWMMTRDYTIIQQLQGKLDGDVVGVAEGKRDLVRLAKQGYVAGRTDEKPVATALLAGPTGTGKSYIAKSFADFLGMRLITLDMTAYKEPSSFKIFTEVLARALTNNPYAVYLFEEIDKASIEVLDQLYFMMDEGIFYDNYQRPLFARGAFILMTTNAASDVILQNPDAPNLNELVQADLMRTFRASFLNRFDAVSVFKPFSNAEFRQLAGVMATKKARKVKEFFGWELNVDDAVLDYIAQYGRSAQFGARPMERLVETVIGGGVAEYQMNVGVINEDQVATVSKREGTHDFRLAVTGAGQVDYTVNPDNNGGGGAMPFWTSPYGLRMASLRQTHGRVPATAKSAGAKFMRWLESQREWNN